VKNNNKQRIKEVEKKKGLKSPWKLEMTISSAQPQPRLVLKCDKQPQKSDKGWINPQ
jgi:hypothetical protein